MKTVKVFNLSKNEMIIVKAYMAENFFTRFKGLLGKKNLEKNSGMILKPCNSIHTFGMKFSIDVMFVDVDGRICRIIQKMPKGKVSPIIREAVMVIETAAGIVEQKNIEVKDKVEIIIE